MQWTLNEILKNKTTKNNKLPYSNNQILKSYASLGGGGGGREKPGFRRISWVLYSNIYHREDSTWFTSDM